MRRIVKILFALVMALLALLMAVSSCTPQSALTASVAEDSAPAADEAVPEMTLAPLAEDDAVILPGGPGPAELEPAAEGPLSPGVTVDEVAADAFNRFVSDAQAAGYGVTAWRGYIDYWTTLENFYEPAVYSYGAETASKTTFVPGCHDHQTALCVDLRYNGSDDFRGTEAWDWLITHCADYGIILRYPEGQESWYGTACMCPCHFRYVGVEPAKYITDNNITLEQFMLLYDWDILYVPGVN